MLVFFDSLCLYDLGLVSALEVSAVSAAAMAATPSGMLEYFAQDHEGPGPWFPPLHTAVVPLNLQLMAVTEHDFRRPEQPPVTFTLHHVGQDGRRTEYLVRLVAMGLVNTWMPDGTFTLDPALIHGAEGHESLQPWTDACQRSYRLANHHQPPRYFDEHVPRGPPRSVMAQATSTWSATADGGVQYDTPLRVQPLIDEPMFRWVTHNPPEGSRLEVNMSGRTPGRLVATCFMTNGVPVSYNLAIHGAYLESRHLNHYNNEVARLLRRWTGDLTYAAAVPTTR
jgi:hypothetical protein